MHYRLDILSGGKNGAMNEAFVVGAPAGCIDRRPVKRELHKVLQLYAFRGTRSRHEETIRAIRVANADMAETVHNPLTRENPVCSHQIREQEIE
jgi:hypothetical protein